MEIIKTYSNLTPLGSATLLHTGWSTKTHMFYQWFLHFESSDPEKRATEIKQTVKIQWEELRKYLNKTKGEKELLEMFMDEGLMSAKKKLCQFIQEREQQQNIQLKPDTELKECPNWVSLVLCYRHKFNDYFGWMAENVQQAKLKECIQIVKKIQYID